MFTSDRMKNVQSPIIPIVGKLIRDHEGTISLGQGVVHYGPPQQAFIRVSEFLQRPQNKYDAVDGTPELRQALEKKLVKEYGVAAIPGTTFGMQQGCYLRISYGALEKDTVAQGVGRLVKGLSNILCG